MTLQDAITLIKNKNIVSEKENTWADLGCGSGLFTYALASFLNQGSLIYAVDKNITSFKSLSSSKSLTIKPIELDFEKSILPFSNLDGIIMANSLHFVKDKSIFLEKMKSYLKINGCFLIVEYDTEFPNRWVPYPVSFSNLKELFSNAGFAPVIKLNEKPSLFNRANLYSAIIINQPVNERN